MTWLDWSIVGAYLAVVCAVGIVAGRRQRDTEGYFLGSRALPLWAVVGSILATEVSAATLVAVPAVGYGRGLVYLQTTIGAVASRLILGWLFIGVFYRHRVTTVYEFLGRRFGGGARTGAAGVFLVGRLFASGVRLFIAAVAFHGLTGLDLPWAILVAGGCAIAYGAIGGLAADVWTDVLQGFAFLAVGAVLVATLLWRLGGPAEAWAVADAAGRTACLEADFQFWTPAFWANPYTLVGAVVGGCTLGLATHGTDQENVQRMLACRSGRQARWSVVLAGLCDLPVAALFAGLGVLLFAYYETRAPGFARPAAADALTTFVLTELPVGFAGLLVAAVFAAAMSSIDSTLNAMAASTVTDFVRRWRPDRPEAWYLARARFWSLAWGLLLVLVAVASATWKAANPATPLIDMALGVMNLFYGSLLGAFVLGLFTRRGTSRSILAGMAAGVAATTWLQFGGVVTLGWTWLIVVGTLVTTAVGAIARSPGARSRFSVERSASRRTTRAHVPA